MIPHVNFSSKPVPRPASLFQDVIYGDFHNPPLW
jgi:hypothetical protein